MPYTPQIYTCDDDHEPIAYACQYCPVCDARREVEEHEKENDELRKRVQELEEQLGLQQPVNGGRHE
jgi:transcription initiation factor IIE alpha subunit